MISTRKEVCNMIDNMSDIDNKLTFWRKNRKENCK